MKAFDIVVQCERGEYKLFEAKVIPTKKDLEDLQETLIALDLGKIKRIVIENIKQNNGRTVEALHETACRKRVP